MNPKPSESTIVVCGVARDVALDLEDEIKRISMALKDFKQVFFVVVESLSKDGTIAKLKKLSRSNPNFVYDSIQHSEKALFYRAERMAEARNRALEIQRLRFPDAKYIFAVDLDGVNRDLTDRSVLSCFKHKTWDVMTCNQPKGYYDILALRHDYWNPHDWGQVYEELREYMPDQTARYLAVMSRSIKLPVGGALVPVKSAFGGGAIYKTSVLENLKYSGFDDLGQEVCEHVSLNLEITGKGGRIYINPDFVNVKHLGRSHSLKKKVLRNLGRL